MREIYDIFTKETIKLERLQINKKCKELDISSSNIYGLLNKKCVHLKSRYILPENKHKIFTLVNLDSGKEYDCIVARSLANQLGLPMTQNEIKYVHALVKRGREYASICDGVFYLKTNGKPTPPKSCSKNPSEFLKSQFEQRKLRKKIYGSLSSRIRDALRFSDIRKSSRTAQLLGCSIMFFIEY
jgi:hypothetical protein